MARGFFRLWIVISAVWVLWVALYGSKELTEAITTLRQPDQSFCIDAAIPLVECPADKRWALHLPTVEDASDAWGDVALVAGFAFLPPIALALVFAALAWVVAGFRRKTT